MSLAIVIAPAIMDTVLGHLALLFLAGAGGDLVGARYAAAQMLAAYNAETPDELCLAAEIISFGLHALEALNQAAGPDQALTKILRLRGSAVSLSREGHKAQRKLDQLQRARMAGSPARACESPAEAPAPRPEATPAQPPAGAAIDRKGLARPVSGSVGKTGGKTWTKGFQQREMTKRIALNLKKNQAAHIASVNAAVAAA